MCWKQQQQSAKKRKYGVADAQDGATSPEVDHMVTHTPTAVISHAPRKRPRGAQRPTAKPSAYVELTERGDAVLWGLQ